MSQPPGPILAFAGGVGGAKLARGLAMILAPDALTVAVNTGDDFEHLGLHVSPDLDTVMYTLAGRNDQETGWGLAGETWRFMEALEALGGETWFKLGDQDLATHIERTRLLAEGRTLSEVTGVLAARFGIDHAIVPMSDDPVRTMLDTDQGRLAFQDYFVRLRATPEVSGIDFAGSANAAPSAPLAAALASDRLAAIVLCPSNPVLSILPILDVPGVRALIGDRRVPLVAISPIIGGKAVKGPAVAVMRSLGHEASAAGVAAFYRDLALDGLVIDRVDAADAELIEAAGTKVLITDALMRDADDSARLAGEVLAFAATLGGGA
jgi:LPPG:FO 2-phospho-L-lactate transferase